MKILSVLVLCIINTPVGKSIQLQPENNCSDSCERLSKTIKISADNRVLEIVTSLHGFQPRTQKLPYIPCCKMNSCFHGICIHIATRLQELHVNVTNATTGIGPNYLKESSLIDPTKCPSTVDLQLDKIDDGSVITESNPTTARTLSSTRALTTPRSSLRKLNLWQIIAIIISVVVVLIIIVFIIIGHINPDLCVALLQPCTTCLGHCYHHHEIDDIEIRIRRRRSQRGHSMNMDNDIGAAAPICKEPEAQPGKGSSSDTKKQELTFRSQKRADQPQPKTTDRPLHYRKKKRKPALIIYDPDQVLVSKKHSKDSQTSTADPHTVDDLSLPSIAFTGERPQRQVSKKAETFEEPSSASITEDQDIGQMALRIMRQMDKKGTKMQR